MREVIKAIIVAAATIGVSLIIPKEHFYPFWAILLALAAGVYIGFAVVDENTEEYYLQWAVALIFAGIAFLGVWISPNFLVLGWLAHAIWDLLHHYKTFETKTSSWYPVFCLIYDVIIAAFLLVY